MKSKYRNIVLGAIGAVIVIVIVIIFIKSRHKASEPLESSNPLVEISAPEEIKQENSTSKNVKTVVKKSNDGKGSLTYAEALDMYKDRRIQLDDECQAFPNNITYKQNTDIMIDNRSGVSRQVSVGSTIAVPAYGFKIVNISSVSLPQVIYIDCNESQNVATILIQE